ncbi:helix-turn-helix domain-containing protein [Streptomyces sp. DH8]|uniref:helix-turn-helix domain-containing protein n=1 Tax=Streptomyces sp. DH8 TaxID=2857008 RepID=UPI001E372323|nr:helix-turn-helix transcriptional regulator [Streptomyces sp. DH8]
MSRLRLNAEMVWKKAEEVGDITLDAIAQRAGLDESTMSRLLAGRTTPQTASLVALKTAYEISLDALLIIEPVEPAQRVPA